MLAGLCKRAKIKRYFSTTCRKTCKLKYNRLINMLFMEIKYQMLMTQMFCKRSLNVCISCGLHLVLRIRSERWKCTPNWNKPTNTLNTYNKTMSIVLDTHKCRAYCCYRVESGAVTTDQSGQVLVWAERYSNDYVFGLN